MQVKVTIFLFILCLILLLYNIYKYFRDKEILEFYKNEFILNNKYAYNVEENDFTISITKVDFMVDKDLRYSAIVDLKLKLKDSINENKIKNLENSLKILKKLKKYNKNKFYEFIANHFSNNDLIIQILEKEIENAK